LTIAVRGENHDQEKTLLVHEQIGEFDISRTLEGDKDGIRRVFSEEFRDVGEGKRYRGEW
jgi:hypothetical protein